MLSPYQISEETLGKSTMQRGLPGMVSQVAPGPNMYDQGAMTKPSVNAQPSNNQRLEMQEMSRNIESAAPQSAAGAVQNFRSQNLGQYDAESKAQQLAATRMAEVRYANDSGTALMTLNSKMQSPERSKFLNDIAVGKAMTAGMNPDLGQEVATSRRYG